MKLKTISPEKLNSGGNKMDKIEFSYNWNNKLNCMAFTTLRLFNKKYTIGQTYTIKLNGVDICKATIVDIKPIRLEQVNNYIAYLDTGYNREKCIDIIRTMYKNSNINWDTQQLMLILLNTK